MEPVHRRLCHEELVETTLAELAVSALSVIMVEELIGKLLCIVRLDQSVAASPLEHAIVLLVDYLCMATGTATFQVTFVH